MYSFSLQGESPESKIKTEGAESTMTPERKRGRRKSKIETLDIHEMEAGKPCLTHGTLSLE